MSMSILDDAIREHLDLKRAHGADESELKRLQDEAFGPPGGPDDPDSLAEAPTEFMATPEADEAAGGRRINIADLQEPPPEQAKEREEPQVEAVASVEPEAEAPPLAPAEDTAQAAPPAEEPPVPEPEEADGERKAIDEQPTELFDGEAEIGSDAPAAEAEPTTEIHASRAEAPEEQPAEEDEEDEDFWSDQRLSDEL